MTASLPSARTVLITGGSIGIGAAFADRFARQGHPLVLVARTAAALESTAARLRATYGVNVDTIAVDLEREDGVRLVLAALQARGVNIDILVNNAGFGDHGAFEQQHLETIRGQLAVNVSAVVELTHALLPTLLARRGGVINVASTASFQPVAWMAVYAATKAFVLSFSEALWGEYRGRVRVLCVCPGATDTAFFARAGRGAQFGALQTVDAVVDEAMRAWRGQQASVVTGWMNAIAAWATRLVPRHWLAAFTAQVMRPSSAAADP